MILQYVFLAFAMNCFKLWKEILYLENYLSDGHSHHWFQVYFYIASNFYHCIVKQALFFFPNNTGMICHANVLLNGCLYQHGCKLCLCVLRILPHYILTLHLSELKLVSHIVSLLFTIAYNAVIVIKHFYHL